MDQGLYQEYLRSPSNFKEHIMASKKSWVIVDEIQRLPELLNYVHQLIELLKIKFVLTGSSARKLKKKSVNLLAGRALSRKFHPLTTYELGSSFSLEKSLLYGHLPESVNSQNPKEFLRSYVGTYLREEVQQEALVRNISIFGQFLESLAFSQGQVLSAQSIASDLGIDRKTVESYVQIIEDLLLGIRIPVFQKKAKRKMSTKPKFYYFDVGVYHTLRKKGPLDLDEEIAGPALETLVLQDLRAIIDNKNYDAEIYFYRTTQKIEVDFVIYGNDSFSGIEVKRTSRIREEDLAGIRMFKSDYPKAKCFIFAMEKIARVTEDGIEIIPLEYAMKNLEAILF